jgi:hypothetical protein
MTLQQIFMTISFELYNNGKNTSDISKKLIADNHELITNKYSSNDFWFTLALAQWGVEKLKAKTRKK